jgi:hypothetical protein
MQIEERTYFEEEQRMDSRWMWFFVLFASISTTALIVGFIFNEEADWLKIGIVSTAIVFSDVLIFYLFKTMKLELALSKKGFHYRFFAMMVSQGIIGWSEITGITFRKSPARGYGKKLKYPYGEIYTMNTKTGVELHLNNGKKKFFSLKDPDAFRTAFNKLELRIRIE